MVPVTVLPSGPRSKVPGAIGRKRFGSSDRRNTSSWFVGGRVPAMRPRMMPMPPPVTVGPPVTVISVIGTRSTPVLLRTSTTSPALITGVKTSQQKSWLSS
jgi:hypothetical protein